MPSQPSAGREDISFTLPRDITAQIESELDTVQNLSPSRMLKLTRYGSWNDTFVRNWSALIEPYRQLGVPDQSSDPDGFRRWMEVREGWRLRFKPQFAGFNRRNQGHPEAYAGLEAVLREGGTLRFWMLNDAVLVSRLISPGRFGAVFGLPDMGKTDTMFYLGKTLIDLFEQHVSSGRSATSRLSLLVSRVNAIDSRRRDRDFLAAKDADEEGSDRRQARNRLGLLNSEKVRVIVNAQISPDCPYASHFTFAPTMLDMVREQHRNVAEGGFSFVLLDEFARFFSKLHQNRLEAEQIMSWIRVMRKPNSSCVISTQNETDPPSGLSQWFTTRIWKRTPYRAQVDIDNLPGYSFLRVSGFPTVGDDVVFNSMEASNFDAMNLDLQGLDYYLSQYRKEHPMTDPVQSTRELARVVVEYCDAVEKKLIVTGQRRDYGGLAASPRKRSRKQEPEAPDDDSEW